MGLIEIDKKSSCRGDSQWEIIYRKTFEGIHPKLPLESFDRALVNKSPFFEGGNVEAVSITLTHALFKSSWDKEFLWCK